MAVLIYRISQQNRIDFTHAYVPLCEFDAYRLEGDTAVMEKDGAYIGLKAKNGLTLIREGATAYREMVSAGRENIWIIRVGVKADFAGPDEFLSCMKAIRIEETDGNVTVTDGTRKMKVSADLQYTGGNGPVYRYPLSPKGVLEIK